MFRSALAVSLLVAVTIYADGKVPPNLPTKLPAPVSSVTKAIPYIQAIHQVLDSVTSRESPTVTQIKKTSVEARNEWVVHRVKANVWVERTASNYLGELGVRVSVPCLIEFGFDLAALKPDQFRYDSERRLLIVDLPDVRIREPIPLLAEMKIEPRYKGLRNTVLDADAMRRLQAEVLQQDYQPAARDAGATEMVAAQRKARDLVHLFLRDVFAKAGADVEVIVR